MGKKPVHRLIVLFLGGVTLAGCQNSNPRPLAANSSGSPRNSFARSGRSSAQQTLASGQSNPVTDSSSPLGIPSNANSGMRQASATQSATGSIPSSATSRTPAAMAATGNSGAPSSLAASPGLDRAAQPTGFDRSVQPSGFQSSLDAKATATSGPQMPNSPATAASAEALMGPPPSQMQDGPLPPADVPQPPMPPPGMKD